jgi:hypothetical protein
MSRHEKAFPGKGANENVGMDLRDYFAAKALAGMLADRENVERFDAIGKKDMVAPQDLLAAAAYAIADAMMRSRK